MVVSPCAVIEVVLIGGHGNGCAIALSENSKTTATKIEVTICFINFTRRVYIIDGR